MYFIHKYTRCRHPCGQFDIYLLWKWDSLITLWHVKTLHIIIRVRLAFEFLSCCVCHLITIYASHQCVYVFICMYILYLLLLCYAHSASAAEKNKIYNFSVDRTNNPKDLC